MLRQCAGGAYPGIPAGWVPRGCPRATPGVFVGCPRGSVPRDTHGLAGVPRGCPRATRGICGVPLAFPSGTGNLGSARGTKVQGVPREVPLGYTVGSPRARRGCPRDTPGVELHEYRGYPDRARVVPLACPGGYPGDYSAGPRVRYGYFWDIPYPEGGVWYPRGGSGMEVTWGSAGVPRGFPLVPQRYPRGTPGVLGGHL